MATHDISCQCGALRITASADPDFVVLCNCDACKKRTGAAFGVGAYFRKDALSVVGDWTSFERTAESGRKLDQRFCPACGTTVFWSLEMRPGHYGVALGAFNGPKPEPTRAIWTQETLDWVRFPEGLPTYPRSSPS